MLKAFGFFEKRDNRDSRDNREIYYHSDDTLFRCDLFRLCGLCGLKKTSPSARPNFLSEGHTQPILGAQPNFLSEGVRCFCSLGAQPNFLSEGRRVLHSAKKATMGSTLTYVPLSPFLLGAAIDPLSQEIRG